jgi:aminomethyltransferase
VAGARATISRTGCTGERGFEIFVPPQFAQKVWQGALDEGQDAGAIAAGLEVYDTLRLEAGWRRHGSDIDETTSVLEAGLASIVAWDKGDFIGRAELAQQNDLGLSRRLVGFEIEGEGIARPGDAVYLRDARVGAVTSGAESPQLMKAIGLAYLPIASTEPGSTFDVVDGGRRATARVVALPFYKRPKG